MIWGDKDLGDSLKTLQIVHSHKQSVQEESARTAGSGAYYGQTCGQGCSNKAENTMLSFQEGFISLTGQSLTESLIRQPCYLARIYLVKWKSPVI